MEKICCASCKNRGKGFETRDEAGIQHCARFDHFDERLCISRNHQAWEPDAPGNAQQQVQADPGKQDSLT